MKVLLFICLIINFNNFSHAKFFDKLKEFKFNKSIDYKKIDNSSIFYSKKNKLTGVLWPQNLRGRFDMQDTYDDYIRSKYALNGLDNKNYLNDNFLRKNSKLKFYGPIGSSNNLDFKSFNHKKSIIKKGYDLGNNDDHILSDYFKEQYFQDAPTGFLIDPQNLISSKKSDDIRILLNSCEKTSDFGIYVMVFKKGQKIPNSIDLNKIHNNWFSDKFTALILYYQDQPERTQFIYSSNIVDSLSSSVFRNMNFVCLDSSKNAYDNDHRLEQIADEMISQLSRLTFLIKKSNNHKEISSVNSKLPLINTSSSKELLLNNKSKFSEFRLLILLLISLIISIIGSYIFYKYFYKRSKLPIYFNIENEFSMRLNGRYCGGTSSSLSFNME